MTGAEMVFKTLEDQGVKHIFGYPGGAGLTAGAVFGRTAGANAASFSRG